jgi:DNA-binding PadR family transcriptional regulator
MREECNDFGRGFGKMHKFRKLSKLAAMGGGRRNWGDFGDFGEFGDMFGGQRRGPRGLGGPRRRMFAGGELRLVLLRLIADEPRHGYELIKAIEELTGGNYTPSPGTIYPTLQLLADEGAIAEADGEGARKPFAVTPAGEAELTEKADEAAALIARLSAMDERGEERSGKSPELVRALVNFGAIMRNRAFTGGLDQDSLRAIVDIIDDAAKRIERL